MDINEIAKDVSKLAVEIADDELKKYKTDKPELEYGDELKANVYERAISQLTFHISAFRAAEDGDLKEQFEDWFHASAEEDLRKACKRAIADELKKKADNPDSTKTYLEQYLEKHNMHL